MLQKLVTIMKRLSCDGSWDDLISLLPTEAREEGSDHLAGLGFKAKLSADRLPIYCAIMLLLVDIAEEIAKRRKTAGLSQIELAKRALVSRSTLESLENGRIGELGYAKINRILMALGLEFKMQEMNLSRPTLDELMIENEHEDALLRRSKAARIQPRDA